MLKRSLLNSVDNWTHFTDQLASSYQTVYSVAHWLTGKGYSVTMPKRAVAASAKDASTYVDEGDLFLHLRLEVKRRKLDFTCKEDFPFPDIMVCSRNSYDRADPKPFTYYMVNKAGSHAAIVRSSTSKNWTIQTTKDGRRVNYQQEIYYCPVELLEFVKLPGALPTPSSSQQIVPT